jgi:hypothetical protein
MSDMMYTRLLQFLLADPCDATSLSYPMSTSTSSFVNNRDLPHHYWRQLAHQHHNGNMERGIPFINELIDPNSVGWLGQGNLQVRESMRVVRVTGVIRVTNAIWVVKVTGVTRL